MGYWPSSLFSILSYSATSVTWGGEVTNEQRGGQHTTTQMGSGHFAEEGPHRASFFQNLKVIDHEQILRGPRDNRRIVTHPDCYNLLKRDDFFYYGGPGRSSICPWSFKLLFKSKEKERKIRRWELFSSSLHFTPNVPPSHAWFETLFDSLMNVRDILSH